MTLRDRVVALVAITLVVAATLPAADAARRAKKQADDAPPVSSALDKRDRTVTAPGSPFNGRAFWQAAAQCGGIYFRLNTIYAEQAITAKVTKPDPAAFAKLSKDADGASTTATMFFDAAERILIADRKLERSGAVLMYDSSAHSAGDRLKSSDAAVQATKPCPELYKVCHGAFPQICPDTGIPTN